VWLLPLPDAAQADNSKRMNKPDKRLRFMGEPFVVGIKQRIKNWMLGSVDNERNGGVFGQKSPSAALE